MNLLKLVLLLSAFFSASSVFAGVDDFLVTPGATTLSYCNSKVFDQSSKYFNLELRKKSHSEPMRLNWKNCRIVKEEPTKLTGQKVETNRIAEKTDIEVILEVDAADKEGKYHLQKYWFLLRHYPVGWQIISYNLIGD